MQTPSKHRTRRTPHVWASAAACALILAACGGSGESAADADVPATAAEDAAAENGTTGDTVAADTIAESDATEDTGDADAAEESASTEPAPLAPEEAPGDGLSAATAAPIVGAQFAWTESGAEWDIVFEGFMETDRTSSEDGTCAALFGTATLRSTDDGNWNSGIQQPQFGLLLGGEYVKPRNNACSDDINAAKGYRYDSRLTVTPGTGFPFVAQFQLDDFALSDVEALVVGTEDAEVQQFFQPTALAAVPGAQPVAGDLAALPAQPLGTISTTASQGEHEVTVLGIVSTPASDLALSDEGAGTCVAVVTTMTAGALSEGVITASTPSIGLIADGQLLSYFGGDCDLDPVQAAGFQTGSTVRMTPGTSVDLSTSIFVPDELTDADLVLAVSLLPRSGAQLFELDLPVSNDFPAPAAPTDASVLPASEGPMAPGSMTYAPDADDTTWTIEAAGLVDGGLSVDGQRQCWHAPMTLTASADENSPPQMLLISDGQAHSSAVQCLSTEMKDAGWESLTQVDFTAGTAQAGFATFSVPLDSAGVAQQFVIGVATTAQPIIVRDVTLLTAIPAPTG